MSETVNVIDEYTTTSNYLTYASLELRSPPGYYRAGNYRLGVLFAGRGTPLHRVQLYMYRNQTLNINGRLVVRIYNASSEVHYDGKFYLVGNVIAESAPIAGDDLNTIIPNGTSGSAANWVSFNFDGTFTPKSGSRYYLTIENIATSYVADFPDNRLLVAFFAGSLTGKRVTAHFNQYDGVDEWGEVYQSYVRYYDDEVMPFRVLNVVPLYAVTYDGNGSTGGSVPVDGGSPYSPNSSVTILDNTGGLVKANHTFLGWSINPSDSVAQYTQGQTFILNANTVFYAVWQKNSKYSVVYHGDGADGGQVPVDGNLYYQGDSVTVRGNVGGLVRSGYAFLGWGLSSGDGVFVPDYAVFGGSSVVPPSFTMGGANVVLYAVWGSVGGGGGFNGGTINGSLEVNCKFPYLSNASQIFSWMTAAVGNLPDYSAFLRFSNVNTPPVLSTDLYGIAYKDDSDADAVAVGVNDSLFVRKDLFVRGVVRSAKDILPLEKWTSVAPIEKILDVDLGSAAWPFHDITILYGHIGNLTVPEGINTDWIQSLSNVDLTITPHAGKKIKLDGNVQITGTLTGGGQSAGGTFNGGEITQPIDIKCKFPHLKWDEYPLKKWLYTPTEDLEDYSAYIRFSDINKTQHHIDIYGVITDMPDAVAPGIMIGHHLYFRGDMYGRGILGSYEGVVALHGGFLPEDVPCDENNTERRACGWAPTHNPMIWLSEAGYYGAESKPKADTLEIRISDGYDFVNHKILWVWGHLEANNVLCHGFVGTDYLSSLDGSGNITLNNHFVPVSNHALDLGALNFAYRDIYGLHVYAGYVDAALGVKTEDIYSPSKQDSYIRYNSSGNRITLDGNVTVTGTLNAPTTNPFNQNLNTFNAVAFTDVTMTGSTTISGNITCHGALDVSHLRCDGGTFIALYSHIEPNGSGINLGSWDRKFNDIFCGGKVYTSRLERASTTGFIALYNSLEPNGSLINLGSSAREFENLYVKNLHVSGSGGGASNIRKDTVTTLSNGTLNVTFTPAFSSGYTPTVTCTVNDSQGRAIAAVITAKSNTGFSVKTFLISAVAHKHKIGEARQVVSSSQSLYLLNAGIHSHVINTNSFNRTTEYANTPHEHALDDYYAVSPSGNVYSGTPGGSTHTHSISNAQFAHSTYNCGNTSHRHDYPDYYSISPTVTAGDHGHTFVKPDYLRELAFRNQAGVSHVIGLTLTQYNNAEVELWTEDNNTSNSTSVGIAATVEYTAV